VRRYVRPFVCNNHYSVCDCNRIGGFARDANLPQHLASASQAKHPMKQPFQSTASSFRTNLKRSSMTQSELSNLIMKQCSHYGAPSTLRALVPFLLTAAPEAVPFVEAADGARDEFYRANGIRPWRRQE